MDGAPTKQALKRLASDVRALHGDTLADHGIYYRHNTSNVLLGQAVIIGGDDTPYEGGCYVFDFSFPVDYPHRPPVATFRTVDKRHRTRFNPNCYRNGKVCLSVLNTWQGDQWTGCQTISSVLLAIKANVLAVSAPLLNEPGVTRKHADFDAYHDIVTFKNMEVAVWDTASEVSKGEGVVCPDLRSVVAREFLKRRESFKTRMGEYVSKFRPRAAQTSIYSMEAMIDYPKLLEEITVRGPAVHKSLKDIAEIDV